MKSYFFSSKVPLTTIYDRSQPFDPKTNEEIGNNLASENPTSFQDLEFEQTIAKFQDENISESALTTTDSESISEWSDKSLNEETDTDPTTNITETSHSTQSKLSVKGKASKSRKRKAATPSSSDDTSSNTGSERAVVSYHLPRIWKSDIRRQYATMFANVYNACDYNYMMKYIETFYRSDMTLALSKGNLERKECSGFDHCTTVWYERMHDAPDLAFELKQTQMKLRSDGTSVVSASFVLTGTKILTLTPDEMKKLNITPPSETPDQLATDSVDELINDPEIAEVLDDIMTSEANDNATNKHLSQINSTNENPVPPILTEDGALSKKINMELVCEIEQAMSIQSDKKSLPASNAVPVPFKFAATGRFALHLDSDSKVYLVDFRMDG